MGNEKKIIMGIDILPMRSPSSRRRTKYAVVIFKDNKIVEKIDELSYYKLIEKINRIKPDIIAVDNIFELGSEEKHIIDFMLRIPPKSKLIQVTGSPLHGMEPLHRLAKRHNINIPSRASPLEEAEASALLAAKGVGFLVSAFEEETQITVSRGRSLGPGGWSQDRYRRRLHALVQQVTHQIEKALTAHKLDFDLYIRRSEHGIVRSKFIVYANYDTVLSLIKPVKGQDVQVKIVPVQKKRIEFLPLQFSDVRMKETKYIIVGVDPGVTTGVAILDMDGNILEVRSGKELTRGEIIRLIAKHGIPIVIATDVTQVPQFVEKLAKALNSQLFQPPRPLTVVEKRTLVQEYLKKLDIEEISLDSHQRDALAAAIKAYQSLKNKLNRIEARIKEMGVKVPIDPVKTLVIQGMSIKDAINKVIYELEERRKKEEVKETVGAVKKTVSPEILDLKEQLQAKEKIIKRLEEQLQKLKEKICELERENQKLKKLIEKISSKQAIEIRKKKEILFREKEIERLKKDNLSLKNEISKLNEKIAQLIRMRIMETRGLAVPLKVIKRFSQEGILEAEKEFGIRKGDVVFLLDASGGGPSTARLLIEKGIRAIICGTQMSHMAFREFFEAKIPVLSVSEVNVKQVDEFAIIDKKELEQAIEACLREYSEMEKREMEEKIEKILERYRRERGLT
ncbi:MAG: DUF460 domain-containing protein [Candidatus Baldrarchaeota archaeon]